MEFVSVERRLRLGDIGRSQVGLIRYIPVENMLYAGGYPGASACEWSYSLSVLAAFGVSRVIDLTEIGERTTGGELLFDYHAEHRRSNLGLIRSGLPVSTARCPVVDDSPPLISCALDVCRRITAAGRAGERVYIHCRGGIGRTATMVGAYLVWSGLADGSSVLPLLEWLRRRETRAAPEPCQREWLINEWVPYVERKRARNKRKC